MNWKSKRKHYGKNANYSIAKKLRKQNKTTIEFEIMFNNLSLEEVIGLKLELASNIAGSKLYGFKIWKSLPEIIQEKPWEFDALSGSSLWMAHEMCFLYYNYMEKVMTQGRDIEEILFEAHAYGMRNEVLTQVNELKKERKHKYIDLVTIYEKAFQQILKQKQKYNYEEN